MTVMFLRADTCHATNVCHITMRRQLSGPSQQTTVMLPRAEDCHATSDCVKLRSVNNCHVPMSKRVSCYNCHGSESKRLSCYYAQLTVILLCSNGCRVTSDCHVALSGMTVVLCMSKQHFAMSGRLSRNYEQTTVILLRDSPDLSLN